LMTATALNKLHLQTQQITCSFLPVHILCIFIQQ